MTPVPGESPVSAPTPPRARLCVGVTGHRENNPAFAAHREVIAQTLDQILSLIDSVVEKEGSTGQGLACTRLHTLLADGTDHFAAQGALDRGWELVVPLPFGSALNTAINAHPATAEDARALLAGRAGVAAVRDEAVRDRAGRLLSLSARALCFELADRDAFIAGLFLAKLDNPADGRAAATFAAEASLRVALAGRVMIEQSDLLIGVWDGATRALIGGTGHTIQAALEVGTLVVWIDARAPGQWHLLRGPEALVSLEHCATPAVDAVDDLRALLSCLLHAPAPPNAAHRHAVAGHESLAREQWPVRSRPRWHAYRRVEALFGADTLRGRLRNLVQTYETPDGILTGSAAEPLRRARALPGQEGSYVDRIARSVIRRFAWADGVSASLSDIYRGGMTMSFLFAALAIIVGVAYLPFASSQSKWIFASFELLLLLGILVFALTGKGRRWHGRWFETRRVAEYLRHSPILLLLGVARAPGRWPQGTETSWPEWCARNALREVGLPHLIVTPAYLQQATRGLLLDHVETQRDYHIAKARRLSAVHHNLDHAAHALFVLAVVSVAMYLVFKGGSKMGFWPATIAEHTSYLFTFFGVLFPTLGGALAGIRFFGDFERFAAISRVTSEKLNVIHSRIVQLLEAPEAALDYGRVADLAHAADDVVVSEIESWQSVFGGKHVTVPV